MKIVPLHQNESYWLLDEQLVGQIREKISASAFSQYPDYSELKKRVADYAGIPEEYLLMSPGSDAAISNITELCVRRNMHIVLPVPTFYGYERILRRHNTPVEPQFYTQEGPRFVFPLKKTIASLSEKSALYLCNPNNPLGCKIGNEELNVVLDAAKKINSLVVLDEAYFEFGGETQKHRIGSQPIVILRTFSKALGLSGGRLGYALSSPDIIKSMSSLQLPWPIAHPTVIAANVLLSNTPKIAKMRQQIILEKERLIDEINSIPRFFAYESSTNFVLVRTPEAESIAARLREQGIYVAETDFMSTYPEAKQLLASSLRIAIPSPKDREKLVSVLKSMTLQHDNTVV